MVTYSGQWQITVISKGSAWDQRVVVTGAATGGRFIAGVPGASQLVDGDVWDLTIEHNDGTGWAENETVLPDPTQRVRGEIRQVLRSKDRHAPGRSDPSDLVIRLDRVDPTWWRWHGRSGFEAPL
jgi:hypothetical protein